MTRGVCGSRAERHCHSSETPRDVFVALWGLRGTVQHPGEKYQAAGVAEVCRQLGIVRSCNAPLHQKNDRPVMRVHCTQAAQLVILVNKHQHDCDTLLPLVLWAYRTAVQDRTGCTPATLMFGRELRSPVELGFGSSPDRELWATHMLTSSAVLLIV